MAQKNIKPATKVQWNTISDVGYPSKEQRFFSTGLERKFLIKGEYSIELACMFADGSGFDLPEEYMDQPVAWAIIDGF